MFLRCSWKSQSKIPASTVAVIVSSSISRILFIFDISTIIPLSKGTVEPTRFVPAPLGVTGILCSWANFKIELTSSVDKGNTNASASVLNLPNVSAKYSSGI